MAAGSGCSEACRVLDSTSLQSALTRRNGSDQFGGEPAKARVAVCCWTILVSLNYLNDKWVQSKSSSACFYSEPKMWLTSILNSSRDTIHSDEQGFEQIIILSISFPPAP